MKFNILNLSVVNPKLPLSNNMTNKCVILSERNMMIPTNALKDTNATCRPKSPNDTSSATAAPTETVARKGDAR